MNNYPPAMSNEDLEYFDSPEDILCPSCGFHVVDDADDLCDECADEYHDYDDKDTDNE
jgi:hypothetical protein